MWMRNRTYCKGRLVAEILVQVLDPKSLNAMQLYDKVALSCGKELAWPVGDLQDDDDDRGISMKVETLDAEVGNTVSTVKVASVYFEHKSIDDVGSHWCFIHETTVLVILRRTKIFLFRWTWTPLLWMWNSLLCSREKLNLTSLFYSHCVLFSGTDPIMHQGAPLLKRAPTHLHTQKRTDKWRARSESYPFTKTKQADWEVGPRKKPGVCSVIKAAFVWQVLFLTRGL